MDLQIKMEELEILKNNWNNAKFPKISENEIYKLILKKSSSTVKWILIVSIIELLLGLILSFGMSFTKYDSNSIAILKQYKIYNQTQIFTIFLYTVIVFFIIRFYLMYKKVSTTDNTKVLMQNILKTRKTVNHYILFNLISFALFFIVLIIFGFNAGLEQVATQQNKPIETFSTGVNLLLIISLIVITALITAIFWLVYQLVYGFLLKKLKRNYTELKKIDL